MMDASYDKGYPEDGFDMTDSANVFISHIHEDDSGLTDLKRLLDSNGLSLRDSSITSDKPNNAKSPDYIKSEILAPAIRWAGTMVVHLTPGTRDSEWVNWEIEYAAKQGKRIVGVWAPGEKDCAVPDALDKYADAVVGWNAERIVRAITGDINDWTNQDGGMRGTRSIARHSCA